MSIRREKLASKMLKQIARDSSVKYCYYDDKKNVIYTHHEETHGVNVYRLSDVLEFDYFTVPSKGKYPTQAEIEKEVMKRIKEDIK